MTETHPTIADTFYYSDGEFRSRTFGEREGEPGYCPSPTRLIASIMKSHRVTPGTSLEVPYNYDVHVFATIHGDMASDRGEVGVPRRTANDLAFIGKQVLKADRRGRINPRLNDFERKSLEYFLQVVHEHRKH